MQRPSDCYPHTAITRRILKAAFQTHTALGPGLLETTYRVCLAHLMAKDGLVVRQEVPIPITFQGMRIEAAYRADLIVDDAVLVELKAVERLMPIHDSQILTYLRHSAIHVGLLLNFNVTRLKTGIKRFVC
jgi:GxxExxY protein